MIFRNLFVLAVLLTLSFSACSPSEVAEMQPPVVQAKAKPTTPTPPDEPAPRVLRLDQAMLELQSHARQARDARRLLDMYYVQAALARYFADNNRYPIALDPGVLLHSKGKFERLNMPHNPTPNGGDYTYASLDGRSYTVTFWLESYMSGFQGGAHQLTPEGIL